MEQRGFVERTVDSGDRRRRLPQLTQAGRDELRATVPVANSVDFDMLARLSADERERLHELLGKLAAAEDDRGV